MSIVYTLNSPVVSNDTNLPIAVRDAVLKEDNGGVRFLFDLGFGFCYPGGPYTGRPAAGQPGDGSLIADIAEIGNGSFVKSLGQTVDYAGGGFDFSTLTLAVTSLVIDPSNHVLAPAVWAGIQAEQKFMVAKYIKMPTSGDWNSSNTIFPFFASSSALTAYAEAADPVVLNMSATSGIQARRQTAVGEHVALSASQTAHYGLVTQVAFWRTATETGLRLKSSAGTTLVTGAAGSLNAADCSACLPRFGIVKPFTNFTIPEHRTARNFRMYRGWIENLALSGRSPAAVLDADWDRVSARNVFS